ncbi:MAG: beta-propeller fold lactonase family protein [Ginsengibacter sp.]
MRQISFLKVSMAIAIFAFVSCNKNADKSSNQASQPKAVTEEMMSENGTNPDEASITQNAGNTNASAATTEATDRNREGHFLYTESNEADNNRILIYKIRPNGSLHLEGTTTSGGAGTGKTIGSQGALVLDKEHEWLYAVNAGSNSVSSFKVHDDGSLTLAHTESSMGTTPNSVSVYGNLLYVLNNESDNIHGLKIGAGGTLSPIEGSTQPLSGSGVDAPQISFTPNGDWVVVTEKATNNIDLYKVKNNGSVWPAVVTASTGQTPFGLEFAREEDFMIVSNAAGGAAGAGSATSYIIGGNGIPNPVNGAVADHAAAPCWVAVTKYGRFAFVTNTAGNTISSYYVAPWGGLYLVQQLVVTTDEQPLDIVVAKNNFYVYELNGKAATIGEYRRKFLGGLEAIGSATGLPAPSAGLATY